MIIGGGIGGLTAAAALIQAGFECVVYEQAPTLEPVGAGLTLWNNALYVLKLLSLAEPVIKAGVILREAEITTQDGRLLNRASTGALEARLGVPAIGIHRASLQQSLVAGLPEGVLRTGKVLVKIEQDHDCVTAYFADGSQDSADLLVAADGIHSLVRKSLFPVAAIRYAGYTAWRGVARGEFDLPFGRANESWGAGSRFGMLWINRAEVYWFATANTSQDQQYTSEENKGLLLERFRDWHSPIERLLSQTPAGEILHNDIIDFQPLKSWWSGRAILIGDAAHATTPNIGQGACQAIESAYALASFLKRHSGNHENAFQEYQLYRQARTAWITRQSWLLGSVAQWDKPLLCSLRNWLVRLAGSSSRSVLEKAAGYQSMLRE